MKRLILCAVCLLTSCGGGGGGGGSDSYDWNGTWVARVTSVNNPCGVGGAPQPNTDVIFTINQSGVNLSVRNLGNNFSGVGSTANDGNTFVASSSNPSPVTCSNGVSGSVTELIGFAQTGDDTAAIRYEYGATCSDLCKISAEGIAARQ